MLMDKEEFAEDVVKGEKFIFSNCLEAVPILSLQQLENRFANRVMPELVEHQSLPYYFVILELPVLP